MRPVVFLDMDGVLVDWYTDASKLLNLDITDPKVQEVITTDHAGLDKIVGKGKVSEIIGSAGVDFWVNLKKLPWADTLIEGVLEGAHGDVAFLSKPGKWPDAYKGKAIWQQANYPDIPLILCRHKGMVASSHSFLVDDDPEQIGHFAERGGLTYHWPNQFNLLQGGEASWQREIVYLRFDLGYAFENL